MDPTSAIGNGKERVATSIRQMIDEADHLLKAAVDSGDQKFDEARSRLAHQLREMRMQIDELEETAVHRARQAARRADQTVHAHPYGAMGIAAAAGLLIGMLVARR